MYSLFVTLMMEGRYQAEFSMEFISRDTGIGAESNNVAIRKHSIGDIEYQLFRIYVSEIIDLDAAFTWNRVAWQFGQI